MIPTYHSVVVFPSIVIDLLSTSIPMYYVGVIIITKSSNPQLRLGTPLDKFHPLKSFLPVIFSMPKPRPQISHLLMWKKKLHVSNGRQTLRSRLTILLLQQNLVHGDQLHYPLLFSILTTSLQSGGFVRLPCWAFGTHVRSAPMISLNLPDSCMP